MVLTPHVVRDQEDFARIHREKMQERKALASLVNRRHSSLPPSVNWRRKIGAFARIERVLQKEESRIENGGKGDGSDAVISPEPETDVPVEKPVPADDEEATAAEETDAGEAPEAEKKPAGEPKETPEQSTGKGAK